MNANALATRAPQRAGLSIPADYPVRSAGQPPWTCRPDSSRSCDLFDLDSHSFRLQLVEMIGVPLHHATPIGQILGEIVGAPDLIILTVRELRLDPVPIPAVLVQSR